MSDDAATATHKYGVSLAHLRKLMERETEEYSKTRPKSKEFFDRSQQCYLYGAPLHWMTLWPGNYPIYGKLLFFLECFSVRRLTYPRLLSKKKKKKNVVKSARGATLEDVDGHKYIDLCLGDTGAMFGHAHPEVVKATQRQLENGTTMMLPTEDSIWVGEELTRRFGLPYWSLTTSATEANRTCIRLARMATKRNKVLI